MDIHRCRFIPYPPQSITALAFSHSSNPQTNSPEDLRLALARENGDIEIWDPHNGLWNQQTVLRGSYGKTVEQLAWTEDVTADDNSDQKQPGTLRLFSTGGLTSITEWDLRKGSVKKHADGNSGDIWCFAAQPPQPRTEPISDSSPSQLLVAGCGDGRIILFSTDDDDLRFLRILLPAPAKKSKILSITWRDRRTVVAGYEDSTIRVVDLTNRTTIRQMTLGKSADGQQSVVWTVKCLPDGTILSGDSTGELKIWDAKNFALVQRLKTHQADILDIVYDATGNTILSFGVDRRTVVYQAVSVQGKSKKPRWTQVMHRRYHEHDIKCAAAFESKDMSVVVSGGMDAVPVVMPLRNLQKDYHRSLPYLPQKPQVSSSARSRLILSWWQRDLLLYHLPKRSLDGEVLSDENALQSSNHELLATLQLKGDDHIQSAQISDQGNLILASTSTGVRLFQLRKTVTDQKTHIRTRAIELPVALQNYGARIVGFSPSGNWIYAIRADNTIMLAKLVVSKDSKDRPRIFAKVTKLFRKTRRQRPSSLGTFPVTISCVSFAADSRILAVGDLSGTVDVWVLEGHEDYTATDHDLSESGSSSDSSSESDSDDDDEDESVVIHGQRWIKNPGESTLPRLDSAILALTFKPSKAYMAPNHADHAAGLHATRHNPHPIAHELPTGDIRLVAITATHQIVEFDVLQSKLSDWSRRNPSSQLPDRFTQIKDRIMGCFWDCSEDIKGERLWMYGATWLYMLDLSQDLGQLNAEKVGQLGEYDVLEPVNNGVTRARSSLDDTRAKKRRKRNRGAGDPIHRDEQVGTSRQRMVKYNASALDGESQGDISMVDAGHEPVLNDSGEDNEENDDGVDNLMRLRREAQTRNPGMNGITPKKNQKSFTVETGEHATDENQVLTTTNNALDIPSFKPNPKIPYWHVFQYRSIFGIVVLSDTSSPLTTTTSQPTKTPQKPTGELSTDIIIAGSDTDMIGKEVVEQDLVSKPNRLEVAIIERPMHDVEMLPRFEGGQDWDV